MLIPRPLLFFATGGQLLLLVVLLVVTLLGGLRHSWERVADEFGYETDVTVHNTTDRDICISVSEPATSMSSCEIADGGSVIDIQATDICSGYTTELTIWDLQTDSVVYDRLATCEGYNGDVIVVTEDTGRLRVADTLPLCRSAVAGRAQGHCGFAPEVD